MLQNQRMYYGVILVVSTIILAAFGLPQHMLLAVSQATTASSMLPTAEAFVPPATIRGTTALAYIQERTLHSRHSERCMPQSFDDHRNADCGESCKENDTINGERSSFTELGTRISNATAVRVMKMITKLSRGAASLILATSLAVAAPMPAIAEWEASILPDSHSTTTVALPLSPIVRESQLILADAAPYTGQLVDTSNAVVVRLDSGVTYNDLREGTGDGVATEGKRVNVQWVLKRSNGYSIDSSALNDGVPFIFVVGNNNQRTESRAIPGLDEGIRGMRVGGIRRIVIPPSLAYVEGLDDKSPGPIPPGFGPKQRIKRVMENRMDVPDESFLLDIKLTRVQ